ncbi:MAG: cyanophycinase [Phycisphaerales bacterium]|nr:cyanophycinase [Phycisphaerales bacterium]
MPATRLTALTTFTLAALALPAWAQQQPATGQAVGQCLAIGGALKDDNAEVFRWMTTRRDTGKVVVCAYATSQPEGADKRMAERLTKNGWKGTVVQLPDALKGPDDRKLAVEWLPHADLVFFTGGDQSRIMERFKAAPDLRQALDTGMHKWATPIAGTSAGAAVMSDPMFTGGGSESALAGTTADDGEKDDPPTPPKPGDKPAEPQRPKHGLQIGPGLGIVQPMIDTHFFARGRFGRLVAALDETRKPYGIGVDENRAVSITGGSICTALGDSAALLVDATNLKRDGLSRTGTRISLMSDGDRWDWPREGAHPSGFRAARTLTPGPVPVAAPQLPADKPIPGAWARNVALDMLKRLAADPKATQVAQSDRFQVVISADEQTRFGYDPARPGALTVVNARLDILERKPAAPSAKPQDP